METIITFAVAGALAGAYYSIFIKMERHLRNIDALLEPIEWNP